VTPDGGVESYVKEGRVPSLGVQGMGTVTWTACDALIFARPNSRSE